MAEAASEITWLIRLLQELRVDKLQPIKLLCDNQSKHIELDCHFTREKVMKGIIQFVLFAY